MKRPPISYPSVEHIRMLPRTYEAIVSTDWLDIMGHMNVAWYTRAFSEATGAVRTMIGIGDELVREQGIGSFALETHTRYVSELRVGDRLGIYSRIVGRTAKRMHAIHFMVDEGRDKLAATFEVVAAHVDTQLRKQTPMSDLAAKKLDDMLAEHSALGWDPSICGIMAS